MFSFANIYEYLCLTWFLCFKLKLYVHIAWLYMHVTDTQLYMHIVGRTEYSLELV